MGRERGREMMEMMEGGQKGREGDGRNKGKRREVDKYNVQNGTYVVEKNQRKGHTLFAHALNSGIRCLHMHLTLQNFRME